MGFDLYVCKKCGEVNISADLGAHQNTCRKTATDEHIKLVEDAVDDEFGQHYVSRRVMAYFHSFWNNFDYWAEHRDDEIKEPKYGKSIKFVKSFMYGFDYGKTTGKIEHKQTKADIKTHNESEAMFYKAIGL